MPECSALPIYELLPSLRHEHEVRHSKPDLSAYSLRIRLPPAHVWLLCLPSRTVLRRRNLQTTVRARVADRFLRRQTVCALGATDHVSSLTTPGQSAHEKKRA